MPELLEQPEPATEVFMSTDLFIYAPGPNAISVAGLHEALKQVRWHVLVLKGTAVVEPTDAPLAVGTNYDVYGAQDAAVLKRARAALTKDRALDRFVEQGLNGIYFNVDPLDPDEVMVDEKFQADVEKAKLHYTINGHGGKLQYALWKALGAATNGLMEDPQSGKVTRAKASKPTRRGNGKAGRRRKKG
jgi:hypothetical protein